MIQTKKLPQACAHAMASVMGELEGNLNASEKARLARHLRACASCRAERERYIQVHQVMHQTLGSRRVSEDFDERSNRRLIERRDALRTGSTSNEALTSVALGLPEDEQEDFERSAPGFLDALSERMGAAPWWVISGAFHGLLLLLLTLIGMAIYRAQQEDMVIVTNLEQKKEPEKIKEPLKRDVFKKPVPIETTEPVVTETQIVTHEEVEVADEVETENDSDAHEARGDEGISDVPLGGSGTVAALGLGGGGGGAFGRPSGAGGRLRRAVRNGGGKATESAVDKALEWLARHQEPDGHWDAWKYEARQEGRTAGVNGNAAVTGFALLAFLGAGHTDRIGKYKDNVRRGITWLVKTLDEQEKTQGPGRYVKNYGSNYTQGVATMALAEASAMCRNAKYKEAAQRAVDGVVAGQIKIDQSQYWAWDYAPGGHTCDTSVTGWNIMALKSAKAAGLHVDPAAFEGAMTWIKAGQDLAQAPKDGDADYWEGGMMTYRGTPNSPNGRKNMAMTAAAALTRLWVGGEKSSSPGIAGPCNLMKKPENLPTQDKSHFNLYYWYYGTLVMFQKGGEHWKKWNEAMKPTLVNSQRKDGDFDGSWDPYFTEATGYIYGGRVQSTALGAVSLEVYYRYLPMYR